MRVEGPRDPGQRPVERREQAARVPRSDRGTERLAPAAGGGTDRVETTAADELGRLMDRVRARLEERERDVLDRREELLARVHDPEAVRRAAARVARLLEDLRGP